MRRARIARDAGRWTDAEVAYKAILATSAALTDAQRAEVLGELGLCELALHQYRNAAEHLARSLAYSGLGPTLQKRYLEGQRRAEAHVVRLYLAVDPPEAEVLIDGRPVPRNEGRQLFLEPGRHAVHARLQGYGDAKDTFSGAPGELRQISLKLQREGAVVPLAKHPAPEHSAGTDPAPDTSPMRTVGVVLTGATALAGATFLIIGAVNHGDLQRRKAELRSEGWGWDACTPSPAPAWCADLRNAEARRDVFDRLGYGFLTAAGALGLMTAAWFLFSGEEPDGAKSVRVAPMTTGQHTAVILDGVW